MSESQSISSSPGYKLDIIHNPASKWKHHPDLYMADGTIVLWAKNVVFRVYPGLLSKHSDVFRGMTSVSEHLPSDIETYDGCPVVRLPDDPEELAYFLEATMGTNYFQSGRPTPFYKASAVLRLASKYMVSSLRQQAIEHFRLIIPNSMDDIGEKSDKKTYKEVFGEDCPHPFELVSLFKECQLLQFLPWAYYLACAEGFDKLIKGAIKSPDKHGPTIRLSDEDSRITLLGWKLLTDQNRKIRRLTILSEASDCNKVVCGDTPRLAWMATAFYGIRSDVLDQWGMFKLIAACEGKDVVVHPPNVTAPSPCQSCKTHWLEKESHDRSEMWGRLPLVFQLPPWEDLIQGEE